MRRKTIAALALSASSLVGLALHEGFRDAAYDDGVGVQTIGFGTTSGVRKGDTITVERALITLAEDISDREQQMRSCIGDVPLHQHEWDAYVSLTYNIGVGAFCGSTLVKRLKEDPPDYESACQEILRWNKAGGHVMQGLVRRRHAEYNLCKGASM